MDKFRILTNNALKIIACVSMVFDHIGVIMFPEAMWLRAIGRLAYPLFAFCLAEGCYYEMFAGCTSLTTAPELPATTLVGGCYSEMFYGCTSLNYIKCLATDIPSNDCTSNWLKNVASTGTFVKNANMTSWTTGDNGIPANWTVQDA